MVKVSNDDITVDRTPIEDREQFLCLPLFATTTSSFGLTGLRVRIYTMSIFYFYASPTVSEKLNAVCTTYRVIYNYSTLALLWLSSFASDKSAAIVCRLLRSPAQRVLLSSRLVQSGVSVLRRRGMRCRHAERAPVTGGYDPRRGR